MALPLCIGVRPGQDGLGRGRAMNFDMLSMKNSSNCCAVRRTCQYFVSFRRGWHHRPHRLRRVSVPWVASTSWTKLLHGRAAIRKRTTTLSGDSVMNRKMMMGRGARAKTSDAPPVRSGRDYIQYTTERNKRSQSETNVRVNLALTGKAEHVITCGRYGLLPGEVSTLRKSCDRTAPSQLGRDSASVGSDKFHFL
jgi:hypothetical protein